MPKSYEIPSDELYLMLVPKNAKGYINARARDVSVDFYNDVLKLFKFELLQAVVHSVFSLFGARIKPGDLEKPLMNTSKALDNFYEVSKYIAAPGSHDVVTLYDTLANTFLFLGNGMNAVQDWMHFSGHDLTGKGADAYDPLDDLRL
ncbi:MAG: hypothetical protein SFT93_05370 [Rickettsiaceae bacterium]|nr:hypothetical protein [Rickettsiaceae bacterium]